MLLVLLLPLPLPLPLLPLPLLLSLLSPLLLPHVCRKEQIRALSQHMEHIERNELGVKGIIHARRVVADEYVFKIYIYFFSLPFSSKLFR